MEDIDSGSLSHRPALGLIVELHRGGVTGSLKLERAPLQKAVFFRDGQILFAASNDPKDQLASILVEEGKLGPDQMQVAQARVSSGYPLAKVLTELGYISTRELADAARIKVEKILTDLYTWNEGTYQFATKSLPKGPIDLDLSTPQLIYASIGRIQDRDWVLRELDTLESVLSPGANLDSFISETKAEPQAAEVLRHVDGVKSVTQIAALSGLGEFDVCKILVAALVVGALTKTGNATVAVSEDAFSLPTEVLSTDVLSTEPIQPETTGFSGVETVGLPTIPPPEAPADDVFAPPEDAVFEAPADSEDTVFEAPPVLGEGIPAEPPPSIEPSFPSLETGASSTASELLIDEPEPDVGDDIEGRTPPRPKRLRGVGSSFADSGGVLKIAAVVVLAAAAAFSTYYFVWPLIGGEENGGSREANVSPTPGAATTAPPSTGTATGSDPRPTGAPPPTGPRPAPAASTTMPAAPTTGEAATVPRPSPPAATTTPPRTGPATSPRPTPTGTSSSTGSSDGARQLLASGNLSGAARAFLDQLRSSGSNQFTIAVGLYCNEDNVGRVVRSAGGSEQLFVLPADIQGRRCYRVVWGLFDSREAADKSVGSLPSGVGAGDATAVPLAGLLR